MDRIELASPAKVNIGLQVRGKRPDGYHTIHTVFQEIALHDTLILQKRSDERCRLFSDQDWVPDDETNLCFRAWQALKQRSPAAGGVDIHIKKRIPAGAGLGGGSGNGATTLHGLRKLFDLFLSDEMLFEIARSLGADVPFFLRGGTQIGDGIGDQLTSIDKPVEGYYLLVIPDIYINTGWAYKEMKKVLKQNRRTPNFAHFLEAVFTSPEIFENDFERILIPAHPEIGVIKDALKNHGARYASLSGSGSTVFGIFDDETRLKRAESALNSHGRTFITTPSHFCV